MSKLIDLTGKRFGHLVVIGRRVRPSHVNQGTYWEVFCLRCGRTNVVHGGSLRQGKTKSCSCLLDSYRAYIKTGLPWHKEDHHHGKF